MHACIRGGIACMLQHGLQLYSEPCKNGRTDRDAVWVANSGGPKEPCIRWGVQIPTRRGNLRGRRGPL